MKESSKPQNKVLNFNQPAAFFLKKAEKHFDAGNFLEALQLYRQVLGMEPDNVEYLLSIAQVYSEMGLYAESNDVLLKIARYGNTPTECLFALGCNYMGMKNYVLADEAFEQYLSIDPNGEFAEEIDELFDILDEEDMTEEGLLHDISRRMVLEEAYEGKQYLDKGDYRTAIKHLENVINRDKTMFPAMNNLSLSYFFDGQKTKAIELSKKVLSTQPLNLHACCNLAFFYSDMHEYGLASEYLAKLEKLSDIDPDDMHKLALTYCELGYHDKAYKWFSKIVSFQPYDIRLLHFCGLAAYNFELYSEAVECFVKVLKIDPTNSLASYYNYKAAEAKKYGANKKLEYVYQVQFDEIKLRIKYLNECLKQKDGTLEDKWKHDEYFRSIILWGLYFGDDYIKKIVIEIMCMFKDDSVEEEFRNFLLKSTEPDEIKNDIFMCLKRIGAKEPYVAYIRGNIVEVRVGSISEEIKNLPKPYADALDCFVKNTRQRYNDDFVASGVELLTSIAKERNDTGMWITKPQSFAAALEYCVSELVGNVDVPLKKDLIQRYGATIGTFNKYYNIIYEEPVKGEDDVN
ncbi:MAG: tetratricopeptide repeat protein [Christensenellales bacterium]|jgi:tetratricopeptide (TPR) repeat protein